MPIPRHTSDEIPHRPLLRDVAEQRIRNAILDGTFRPGEALHDRELQDWLGVSRTPIRDALNELARAGLVEMEANRFTRVVRPLPEETPEAMHTLGVLLGGIIRLALPRLSAEEHADVLHRFERTGALYAAGELRSAREEVYALWTVLAELARNRHLLRVFRDSFAGLFFRLPVDHFAQTVDRAQVLEHQRALVEAVADRAPVAAEQAVRAIYCNA